MKILIKIIIILSIILTSFLVGFGFIEAYLQFFGDKNNNPEVGIVKLTDPITVDFSLPVILSSFSSPIEIYPRAEFSFEWKNYNKNLVIYPKKFWQPETDYRIVLPKGRSLVMTEIESREIKFSTPDYPRVRSFLPAPDAKDVLFDIEDPAVVDFDSSTSDFFVRFSAEPELEMIYENNPEKNQFRLLPKGEAESGKKYEFKIEIKYKQDSDDNFKEIYRSSFETLPLAPSSWDQDLDLRLAQAKKYAHPKISTGKYIDINLENQIMSIFEEGKLLDAFLISSGKRGMDTPKGEFAIRNKTPRAWSKTYGLFMPFWMAIVPGGKYGIHELPEWPGGYKEGVNHLGIPVSHGCVRLGVGSAQRVYDWAEIGTKVVVY